MANSRVGACSCAGIQDLGRCPSARNGGWLGGLVLLGLTPRVHDFLDLLYMP